MSADSRYVRHVPAPVRQTASTVQDIVVLASDRNITYLAAAIAYYAFVSMLPLILLVVAVASFVGGETLAARVTAVFSTQLSSAGQESVTNALTNTAGRGTASLVGFLTLSWSGLRLFRGLTQAFDELYVDDVETSILGQVTDAVTVVVGTGVAVSLVVATGVVLSVLAVPIPFLAVVSTVALVAVLVLTFLPIYYVLPPLEITVREALPGALVAAVGWVGLQVGFRVYAASASQYAAYGIIGGVLLFVTWLYFASTIVLVGAAVNAVLGEST